jgi:hypothetical protein
MDTYVYAICTFDDLVYILFNGCCLSIVASSCCMFDMLHAVVQLLLILGCDGVLLCVLCVQNKGQKENILTLVFPSQNRLILIFHR